jgi:hypothetical protein
MLSSFMNVGDSRIFHTFGTEGRMLDPQLGIEYGRRPQHVLRRIVGRST